MGKVTHAACNHPLFHTWKNMVARCCIPTRKEFKNYGARGITVCARWLSDPHAFFNDVGAKPTMKHTLDRINNNEGYCPENCRWALRSTQTINARLRTGNRTGYKNVAVHVRADGAEVFRVRVKRNYTSKHLGYFQTIEEAITARDSFRQQKQAQSVA